MSFLRQFFIYGLSGAASRLAAVVLVPLYTRTLRIEQYGQLELILALYTLLVIFAGMQIESAVARDYFEAAAGGRARPLAKCALYLCLVGWAVIAVGLAGAWGLGWLPASVDGRTLSLLLAITLPTQIFGVQLVMLRFAARPVYFAVLSFLDLALCATCSAIYIVGFHLGIAGALWGILTGKGVCTAAAWTSTFGGTGRERFDAGLAKRMLHYGIPALPAVLVGWIQTAGSRVLLAISLGLSDIAIAGIAIRVAAIYGFVIYSFRLAWEPFSFARLSGVDADPHVYNRALEWYVVTMFLACGLCSVAAPYVVRVLAPASYAAGGRLAVFFLLGLFWTGVTNVLVIGIHAARRTAQLLPVYASGAAVNVALLLLLAPHIGVLAAAVSSLAGSICTALVALRYSNSHLHTKFDTRLIGWTLLVTMALAATWYSMTSGFASNPLFSAAAAGLAGAGLVLVVALLALIVTTSIERSRVAAMWAVILQSTRTAGLRS